jgi:hypothetical protein
LIGEDEDRGTELPEASIHICSGFSLGLLLMLLAMEGDHSGGAGFEACHLVHAVTMRRTHHTCMLSSGFAFSSATIAIAVHLLGISSHAA